MKSNLPFHLYLQFAWLLFLAPLYTAAQCEIFKSDIDVVKKNMIEVSQYMDSLQTSAENAAYAANFTIARADAKKVKLMIGKAYDLTNSAASMASESQYYSTVCGIDEVISFAVDAESNTLDVLEFMEEAYTNAKNADKAKNLGDLHYYMRKLQSATRTAQKSANSAAYAASDAFYSCTHDDTKATGSNKR